MVGINELKVAKFKYKYKDVVLDEVNGQLKDGQFQPISLMKYFGATELNMILEDGTEMRLPKWSLALEKGQPQIREEQVVYVTGDRQGQHLEWLAIMAKRMLSDILGFGREAAASHED